MLHAHDWHSGTGIAVLHITQQQGSPCKGVSALYSTTSGMIQIDQSDTPVQDTPPKAGNCYNYMPVHKHASNFK